MLLIMCDPSFSLFFDLIVSFNEIILMACVFVRILYLPLVVTVVVVVGGGGDIASLHSCWLCNWPLGWSASTQIKN